ncbi:MAG: SDR family oxidoreductase [Kordiimonadaceae bacterium]|nr:SDR family oxidoreductase [Kordiimonadaceae bacterium]MBO6569084.1 SDR family oxidoreductase [Kordiimonadaceae bacterium]MBO6964559.1 SDR family oxidoreductase [Kordiimonadaceae bacterium]
MFKDQVVWMTGASSGIGEALVYEMAAKGAKLILSARRAPELERVKEGCVSRGANAENIMVLTLDVTDEAAMPGKVKEAHEKWGRIDMLLNNAGISQRSLCVDTDMQTYRTLFEVDVFGQIALTKQVLPIMIEQGSGHMVVTASVAGKIGAAKRTGYCAAKHAMMGFFDALRTEVTRQGIRVTTITPGYIRTAISENALKGDGSEFGETDKNIAGGMDVTKCAKVIMRGFEKGKFEIPVGEGIEMKALLIKRFFPNMLFKMAERVSN